MSPYLKISIVIHSYNRQDYIAETIESVIHQKYPNLECIVIDDGSTDQSWQIIGRYKNSVTHMEHLEGYRDSPRYAVNYGFSKTSGEIMGWLNAKNILLPKSLFVIADVFNQLATIEWITGLVTTLDEEGRIIRVTSSKNHLYDYLSKNETVIQQESTFWRRSLWERTGAKLNEEYPWLFDIELWTRFFKSAGLYHVESVLGAYRKIKTAHSLEHKDLADHFSEKAIQQLKQDVRDQKILLRASLYRKINLLKKISARMSDKLLRLNHLHHPTLNYDAIHEKWTVH